MSDVEGVNVPDSIEKFNKKKRPKKWGFYTRRSDVELFRYNPNYPKEGMKTVILRGKE